jgi:hypothetical protein
VVVKHSRYVPERLPEGSAKRGENLVFGQLRRRAMRVDGRPILVVSHGLKLWRLEHNVRRRCAGFLWEFSSRQAFAYAPSEDRRAFLPTFPIVALSVAAHLDAWQ